MNLFRLLKKLIWMPLATVLLLVSCGEFYESVYDQGYRVLGLGFASDTTAILFKQYWEEIEQSCGGFGPKCSNVKYKDLELQLVDVRFKKVYWSSGIVRDKGYAGSAEQWNDSTMFISAGDNLWLWSIGSPWPSKIKLNWNIEWNKLSYGFNWLHLKKDSILIYNSTENIIIDTKARTVGNWNPLDEYKWVVTLNGKNLWWGEVAGGGYLVNDKDSCRIFLLSEKGDTLSNAVYFNNCERISGTNGSEIYVEHHFIKISKPVKRVANYYSYYYWPAYSDYAYFRYDENGSIAQKPSFWLTYMDGKLSYTASIGFVDSLGNITEY
ncbi:hypothetical protein R83H12_01555 [Fibrobacteria bacterium R8-3-H12]